MARTIKQFSAPANISDFSSDSPLAIRWNEKISTRFKEEVRSLVETQDALASQAAFFNPLEPPQGQVSVAHITWGASQMS
jgi:hypothetical protein